jgi:hypothetical protein
MLFGNCPSILAIHGCIYSYFYFGKQKSCDTRYRLEPCTPEVFGGSVLLMFFVILCYVFVLFVLMMCSVYPMLPVSLYFQFLVTPSVFAKSKF